MDISSLAFIHIYFRTRRPPMTAKAEEWSYREYIGFESLSTATFRSIVGMVVVMLVLGVVLT